MALFWAKKLLLIALRVETEAASILCISLLVPLGVPKYNNQACDTELEAALAFPHNQYDPHIKWACWTERRVDYAGEERWSIKRCGTWEIIGEPLCIDKDRGSPKNKLMEDPYLIPNTFRDPEVEPYTIRSQNGEIYSLLRDYNTQRQRTFSDEWSSNWEALFWFLPAFCKDIITHTSGNFFS